MDNKKTRDRKKRRMRWLIGLVVVTVLLLVCAFDVRLKVVNYTIKTSKVDKKIKIAFLSDLHSCYYGKGQKTLIDAINRAEPDIVLLGGDICDDVIPHENTKLLLEGIANRYPCYYVSGNHEYWSNEVDDIKSMFRSYGVTVLEGECKTLNVNGQTIMLGGIDDPEVETYTDEKNAFHTQLAECEKTLDSNYFSVLLTHRPEYIKSYQKGGFDLVLAGHAHGGQWRLPGILNGLYAPDQGIFPRYAGGMYEHKEGTMIVSRGLARESTRVPRIFNRPELVIVTIESES